MPAVRYHESLNGLWLSLKLLVVEHTGCACTHGSAACTELEVFRAGRLYIGTDDAPRSLEDPVSLGSQTGRYSAAGARK